MPRQEPTQRSPGRPASCLTLRSERWESDFREFCPANAKSLFCSASLNVSLKRKTSACVIAWWGLTGGRPGLSGKGCWNRGRGRRKGKAADPCTVRQALC